MNRLFSSFLLALAPAFAWAQGFTVSGTVMGLNDGDTLLLTEISHVEIPTPVAKAAVKDGTFTLSGKLDEPRGVILNKKGVPGGVPLIVFSEHATVKGSYKENHNGSNVYGQWNVQVTGSALTDQLKEKTKAREDLDKLYAANQQRHSDIAAKIGAARKDKDSVKLKELMATPEYKQMADDDSHFFATVDSTYRAIFRANNDSWWGPFLMEYLMSYLTPEDASLFDMLTPQAQATYYGQMVRNEVKPASMNGKVMPLFTLTEGEKGNTPLALKDVLAKNRYTIVDFWASWCVPCRKEIPNMKKLYALYHDKGLEIVSVSIDKNPAQWKKACQQEQLPWYSYRDTSGIDALYKVQFIPAMFVLDSQGRLVASGIKGQELADKLAELFAK
jgi:thiol-disulfide isomerase/thioredoxin